MGWWGGGTSPIPDIKSLKHRAWHTWKVIGSLKVEELRRGLWLFGFESPNEARRILREGTCRFGGFPIYLREWGKDVGCKVGRERCRTAWVRLLGLPLHLWSHLILKRIGDKCGGFDAVDENTACMIDPRWARIRVKWDGSTNPRSVIVFEDDKSFVIQLWWELQPQMQWESWMPEPKGGNETREEGDENPRAIESVKDFAQERMKMSEKQKGITHREEGKLEVEERQPLTEEARSREEQKSNLVEEQTVVSVQDVREMGFRSRLGPTRMGQQLSGAGGRKKALGEAGGGEPSKKTAQAAGPGPKQSEPLHILGPAEMNLSPVHRGLTVRPTKEQVIVKEKNCSILSERKLIMQSKGANSVQYWKEDGRRDDQVLASSLENDNSRYVRPNHEDSPSTMISVFGRPFLWGGLQVRMVL